MKYSEPTPVPTIHPRNPPSLAPHIPKPTNPESNQPKPTDLKPNNAKPDDMTPTSPTPDNPKPETPNLPVSLRPTLDIMAHPSIPPDLNFDPILTMSFHLLTIYTREYHKL